MKIAAILVLFLAHSSLAQWEPWIPRPQEQQDWMPWIWMDRFQENVQNSNVNGGNVNVLFYGDSITEGWSYMAPDVFERAYGYRGAANYGIGGDGTQHVLWRIINGETANISPKVCVLKIGTNNIWSDGDNTADVARGVTAVVNELQTRLQNTKILLLGILPRVNAEQTAKAETINEMISVLDNGNSVRFLNMRDAYYAGNGQFYTELYTDDLLHLSTAGYVKWEQTMSGLFTEMWNSA